MNITPADLARFIHPVPVGARFPMGLEFADLRDDYIRGPFHFPDSSRVQLADDPPRWTAEPLTTPKPPLPTEVGAVIADVRGPMRSTCHMMTLDGDGEWLGVDADGLFTAWMPDRITDWKPARIVTAPSFNAPAREDYLR